MRVIDKDEALAKLKRAVEAKGADYIYCEPSGLKAGEGATCTYFHPDGPGCIVGYVLSYLGLTREAVSTMDREFNGGYGINNPFLVRHLREQHDIEFTDEALDALVMAQSAQDRGFTWGWALKSAEES